jgi:hypothetical protein
MNETMMLGAISTDDIIAWSVALLFVAIAIMLQWRPMQNYFRERNILKVINRSGREVMHDMMLPDGLGGHAYIEHLVLTSEVILILYLKRYPGIIFAGDNIDEWTQVINNHSYRFPNPLRQIEMDVMSVKSLVKEARVEGRVVFTRGSEFPKGKPANVMLISELEQSLRSFSAGEVNPTVRTAWKRLAEQVEPCSKEFIHGMKEQASSAGQGLLAVVFLLISAGWLYWYYVS